MRAVLLLADGSSWMGQSVGAKGEVIGEVVYNTSMTGYQEILTDAACCGEIVAMTYPMIGNYGINVEDFERTQPYLRGFVTGEIADKPSNWRSNSSLSEFLIKYQVVGITGIDTRALTRVLRDKGTMKGAITPVDQNLAAVWQRIQAAPTISQQDLVRSVTTGTPYVYQAVGAAQLVVLDLGVKSSLLQYLKAQGYRVTVVPASTPSAGIMALQPDAEKETSAPGDPQQLTSATEKVRQLIGKVPLFGICLGHLLISQALGGKTYQLHGGHRGGNYPVQDVAMGRVYITTQNHSFCTVADSLPADVFVSHRNLNDGTVEGLRHSTLPVVSVQYQPLAGPEENRLVLDQFLVRLQNTPVHVQV